MTENESSGFIFRVAAAWPKEHMEPATMKVWREHLAPVNVDDAYQAIKALESEEDRRPSIHKMVDRCKDFAKRRHQSESFDRGLPAPPCPFNCDRGLKQFEKIEDGRRTFWVEKCQCGGTGRKDPEPETTPEQAAANIKRLRKMIAGMGNSPQEPTIDPKYAPEQRRTEYAVRFHSRKHQGPLEDCDYCSAFVPKGFQSPTLEQDHRAHSPGGWQECEACKQDFNPDGSLKVRKGRFSEVFGNK